jgi:hypothetical protein
MMLNLETLSQVASQEHDRELTYRFLFDIDPQCFWHQ